MLSAVRSVFQIASIFLRPSPERHRHKATEDRLSDQIGAVKTALAATRSELTAAIEKQTDRIVEVHRDLRGLGERLAGVEANA